MPRFVGAGVFHLTVLVNGLLSSLSNEEEGKMDLFLASALMLLLYGEMLMMAVMAVVVCVCAWRSHRRKKFVSGRKQVKRVRRSYVCKFSRLDDERSVS